MSVNTKVQGTRKENTMPVISYKVTDSEAKEVADDICNVQNYPLTVEEYECQEDIRADVEVE